MNLERNIAPPVIEPSVEVEPEELPQTRSAGMSFSAALAIVEARRKKVQTALAIALVVRLLADFNFAQLVKAPDALMEELPFIGLALLSYIVVLWFLAVKTRDRWGFGMALGIGVLEATYALAMMVAMKQFAPAAAWKPVLLSLAHVWLAFTAFRAGAAYPPLDSKRPWILGFVTALLFMGITWFASPVAAALGWQ